MLSNEVIFSLLERYSQVTFLATGYCNGQNYFLAQYPEMVLVSKFTCVYPFLKRMVKMVNGGNVDKRTMFLEKSPMK